ncbi:hypothetical protein ACFWAR_34905 [Streptomyces sp. NPDC059917]
MPGAPTVETLLADPGLDIAGLGELRLFACPGNPAHPVRLNLQ